VTEGLALARILPLGDQRRFVMPKPSYSDQPHAPLWYADPVGAEVARRIEGAYQITTYNSGGASTVYMNRKTRDGLLKLAFTETRSRRNTRWALKSPAPLDSTEACVTSLAGERVWVPAAHMTIALAMWCELQEIPIGYRAHPPMIARLNKKALAATNDQGTSEIR
jgi:hypothetical protein